MALGQETLTHSRRPRLQNSSSGHAKPLIATRVARFLPVLDKSETLLEPSSSLFRGMQVASKEFGADLWIHALCIERARLGNLRRSPVEGLVRLSNTRQER